jgi:predicted ATP-dependent endonuclease of OLD family
MKLHSVKIENFRSYKDEIQVTFDNFTAFVGRNDIGKSTVLEALDVFFNDGKGIIKLDKDDINKQAQEQGNEDISITVCFEDLPDTIVIDAAKQTTLKDEYLLNTNRQLEVIKKYPKAGKPRVFVKANHPSDENCCDLLLKKNTELRTIVKENTIQCDNQTINAVMRKAIWDHFGASLNLQETEIDVSKADAKDIWEKLQNYLPMYSLFQSDRENSDGDSEVQDPLKEAVKQILSNENLTNKFDQIAQEVQDQLNEVAKRTLDKLGEMDSEIANSLSPVIPSTDSLKWADVFKNVSIAGDDGIPINKRGSGVKRLILLNFFRAEAERRKTTDNIPSIIYAIEEPETSQHSANQKLLIEALLELSKSDNTQVVITTHSAPLVKNLEFAHLRLVKDEKGTKGIIMVHPNRLPYPSLNEANYLAFSEITEEYHNELYGYIDQSRLLTEFRAGKPEIEYKRDENETWELCKTDFIRHQIHHPENVLNERFTPQELKDSIIMMREFIELKFPQP